MGQTHRPPRPSIQSSALGLRTREQAPSGQGTALTAPREEGVVGSSPELPACRFS